MNVFTSRRLTFSNLIGSVYDCRSDNHPGIIVAKLTVLYFFFVHLRHHFILVKPTFFQILVLRSGQSSQERLFNCPPVGVFPKSAVYVRDKDRPLLSHNRQKLVAKCWLRKYNGHRSFPQNKKGLLEFADYSGRPTFSDLLGPVCVYRTDRFTGNI